MAKELGKLGNKKAKTGNLGDGPSLFSSLWRGKGRRGDVDGTIDGESDGGGGEELEDLEVAAEEGSMDPLVVFGSGIMMMILSKLDARSVALARLVSRGWLAVASSDRIWVPKCQELWLGKSHIPRISKAQGLPKMVACSLSIMDGKRSRITRDDLCDHVWEFHFTQQTRKDGGMLFILTFDFWLYPQLPCCWCFCSIIDWIICIYEKLAVLLFHI